MAAAKSRVLGLVLGLLLVAACSFTPLYGTGGTSDNGPALGAAITVAPIPDRLGQQVRNALLDRLDPLAGNAAPSFRLEVDVAEDSQGGGYRPDKAITRTTLRLKARFRLIDLGQNKPVFDDTGQATVSYNVVQSDFANLSAANSARERATDILAGRIVEMLALFLRDRKTDTD